MRAALRHQKASTCRGVCHSTKAADQASAAPALVRGSEPEGPPEGWPGVDLPFPFPGQWLAAAWLYQEDRTGVCERRSPALGDTDHPAACHLYADAGTAERTGEGTEPLPTSNAE